MPCDLAEVKALPALMSRVLAEHRDIAVLGTTPPCRRGVR